MRIRVLLVLIVLVAASCAVAAATARLFNSNATALVAGVVAGAATGCVGLWATLAGPLRALESISDALKRTGDRGSVIPEPPIHAGMFDSIADAARVAAQAVYRARAAQEQGDQMLRAVIDAAPMAIGLLEDSGDIVYSNQTARDLFFEGKALEGHNFIGMLGQAPAPFREAVLGEEDSLFTVSVRGDQETYHLAKRHFELQGQTMTVIMVKHLTREMRRQEVDVWKKLIRVISHELNNSLAPITSLVHSARLIAKSPEQMHRLDRVFDTIEERASHLKDFIERYARFARLPKPRRARVNVHDFLSHLVMLAPAAEIGEVQVSEAFFDPAQMEQTLINLIKNADEAGSPKGSIVIDARSSEQGGLDFVVSDRGAGMSEEVLQSALLPFYSTKERGTGLGLALCREIVEAHSGKIRIENRSGGGAQVTCSLPAPEQISSSTRAKLTLSRM